MPDRKPLRNLLRPACLPTMLRLAGTARSAASESGSVAARIRPSGANRSMAPRMAACSGFGVRSPGGRAFDWIEQHLRPAHHGRRPGVLARRRTCARVMKGASSSSTSCSSVNGRTLTPELSLRPPATTAAASTGPAPAAANAASTSRSVVCQRSGLFGARISKAETQTSASRLGGASSVR